MILILSELFGLTQEEVSTMVVIMTAFTGFTLLYNLSKPLNILRSILLVSMISIFLIGLYGFNELFSLIIPSLPVYFLLLSLISCSLVIFYLVDNCIKKLVLKYYQHQIK